jgi:hypothetical protein
MSIRSFFGSLATSSDPKRKKHSTTSSRTTPTIFAVTAWHLIDWVWAASDDNLRTCISGFFEGATISKMQHLTKAIAGRYRTIHVCSQIANGSKHYIADRTDDPAIEAKALWVTHRPKDPGDQGR